jgi:DNA-binding LytR/AlgR family response regulator
MQNLLHENLLKDAKETENLDNQELLVKTNELAMFKIFRTHHTIKIVRMEDISHISAKGELTKIYLRSGEEILSIKALSYYQKTLHLHPHFFRVHKSTLIHLQQIAEFNYRDNLLIMRNGERVECSRRMGRNLYCFLLNG